MSERSISMSVLFVSATILLVASVIIAYQVGWHHGRKAEMFYRMDRMFEQHFFGDQQGVPEETVDSDGSQRL